MQVNDEVWRGYEIIGIPDLSLMQAVIPVNEVDIAKIGNGMKTYIRLDAYPDTAFSGTVEDIAALARNKERDSKVKVFDVTVVLSETDEILMPGMTVSCEIIINELQDVRFVPLDAVFHKDNQTIVYKKNGSDFTPEIIATGAENDDYVVVTDGLQEGDEVAMVDPALISVLPSGEDNSGE
jgi:multidrug efflux pump subunit AcrA (membrane-fusion protein)